MNPRNVVRLYRTALAVGVAAALTILVSGIVGNYAMAAIAFALSLIAGIVGLHMQTRLLIRTAERQRQRTERLLNDQLHQVSAALTEQSDALDEFARDLEVRVASKVPSASGFSDMKSGIVSLERTVASMEAILVSELDTATSRTIDSLAARIESTAISARSRDTTLVSILDNATDKLQAGQRQILDRQTRASKGHHHFLAVQLREIREHLIDLARLVREELAELDEVASEQRQLSRDCQEWLSFLADSISKSSGELSKLTDTLSDMHEISTHTHTAVSTALSDQRSAAHETQRQLKEIYETILAPSSELASLLSAVSENHEITKDTMALIRTLTSEQDAISPSAQKVSIDELGLSSAPVIERLEESEARIDQVHRSITEGFRATRVGLEQVPQTVEQYRHLHEILAPQKLAFPGIGGWAMTATAISAIVSRVLEAQEHPTIVELGSGISTVWLSLAMRKRGGGRLLALDHLDEFLESTRAHVAQHGAPEFVELIHAPLTSTEVSNRRHNWYDLSQLDANAKIDILVVDGPPGDGGPHARYPALPLLSGQLATGATILVDDTIRSEERDVIAQWQSEFPEISIVEQLDKATLLRWDAA